MSCNVSCSNKLLHNQQDPGATPAKFSSLQNSCCPLQNFSIEIRSSFAMCVCVCVCVCVQQNSTLPSISQTFVGFHDAFDFQASVCFELQKLPHSTATVRMSEVRHTQCTESLGTDEKMHLRLCLCFDSSNTPVGQPSCLGSLLAQLQ